MSEPYVRRVSVFVRGAIYEVCHDRLCPACGHLILQGDRMVADTDDRVIHYDPPCGDSILAAPIEPRPVALREFTFGMDWIGFPWHYIVEATGTGYIALCGEHIRPVREGAQVRDAATWPSAHHCPGCERKGPPKRRLYA